MDVLKDLDLSQIIGDGYWWRDYTELLELLFETKNGKK